MTDLATFWSYLSSQPLLWLTATVVAYVIGDALSQRAGRHPLANPVLAAVLVIAVLLWASGTGYDVYFEGAQFIHFLLGPATVALAVPLCANLVAMRRAALPMVAALAAGSVTAILSTIGLASLFGLPKTIVISLAPKSATAPVALGISESLGGSPTLTAMLVILTGIIGAIVVTPLMNALRIRDWRARGFAVGIAAHGIGTARAFQVHETAGAFAGTGMALNAVLTSVLAPVIVGWLL